MGGPGDIEAARVTPVRGRFLDEILDGYFPLTLSVRQMMDRQDLSAAWLTLTHAPIMYLPGLAPDEPVPLRLPAGRAGLLRRLDLLACRTGAGVTLRGQGSWRWYGAGDDAALPADLRLAEPAYVQGIGLARGRADAGAFGRVARDAQAAFAVATLTRPVHAGALLGALGWGRGRLWATGPDAGLHRRDGDRNNGPFPGIGVSGTTPLPGPALVLLARTDRPADEASARRLALAT